MTLRLIAALAILALAGCGQETPDASGPDDRATLDGRTFVATAITDGGTARPLVPNSELRLSFKDGALNITAGCNHLFGTYRLDGTTLRVSQMGGTDMGCPGPLMEQDTWVAGLFANPATVQVDGDGLRLTAGEVVIDLLDRRIASPDQPLTGTSWVLDSIITGDAASSVPGRVRATLMVAPDGAFLVDTGCNSGRGNAEVAAGTITFGALALTRRACQDDAEDVEQTMVRVLDGEVTWEVTEKSLTLSKGDQGLGFRADQVPAE